MPEGDRDSARRAEAAEDRPRDAAGLSELLWVNRSESQQSRHKPTTTSPKQFIVMYDRDTKFTKEFVSVLKEKGIRTNALPVASPNLNGRME